ncbi:MAG: HAMP domain-containing histidine kinase [Clostridia bacterium]|nr:HAMP domain-containing histidine kinase [Clostridia bacterium]
MKKLTGNIAAKSAAIVLSTIVFGLICFLCVAVVFGGMAGMYTDSKEKVLKNALSERLYSGAHEIIQDFATDRKLDDYSNTNYLYIITYKSGEVVALNTAKIDEEYSESMNFSLTTYGGYDFGDAEYLQKYYGNMYTIKVAADMEFKNSDSLWLINKVVNVAYSMRYAAIFIIMLCIVLLVFLLIFLFCSAGYQGKSTEPQLNYFDKIPLDIFTLFFAVIALFELYCMVEVVSVDFVEIALLGVFLVIDFPLVLWYFLSLATRIKVGSPFKNTVVYKMVSFFVKITGKAIKKIIWLARKIPVIYKTVVITAIVSFAEFFVIVTFARDTDVMVIFWIIEKMIIIPLIYYVVIMFKRLKTASEKISQGNFDYNVYNSDMLYDFKSFALSLNNISLGMQSAVEQRVKSERFKTELITNVSHDIKTPLTSIINYVDLIKKENPKDPKIKEYIGVLERQSVRLKKLIEDLIEASKASTGNINLNMQECQLDVLLAQAIGEYSEKFESKQLTVVIEKPDTPINVIADGRYLWRVFDNLLNNVYKYALSNTRVYVSIHTQNNEAIVVIKNISENQLNVSGDELLERFVRGDASRNTEGNGLGLSIAQSLIGLQNGKIDISVDGDLFKVSVTLVQVTENS